VTEACRISILDALYRYESVAMCLGRRLPLHKSRLMFGELRTPANHSDTPCGWLLAK